MANTPPIDEDAIRAIAAILHEADLSEIEVAHGDVKLRVARHVVAVPAPPGAAASPVPAPATVAGASSPAAPKGGENAVLSPMVGTAYRAPEPGGRPFVEVGNSVQQGQVVIIVEAMKTMNQIIAERAGTVTEIFVEDGQPVEYGEPLLTIV
ncbi:acetyl-CoA carboxylase biotin carboxyl carrier protein [Acuticoccus sp.]|uniref:acetyl-CoA carboxylase biotin carboxyl carrier protein n=1 Tax=Acuticoccus sp. TaxID=1904378 RepID=UPI003B52F730